MAWGLALAVALAVLLWPGTKSEPTDVEIDLDAGPKWAVSPADRQLGRAWIEQFARPAGAYVRLVSF